LLRYKEIKNELKEVIAKYDPFDRLPSRLTLCKQLDTSRTTLDKALKELEAENFIFCKEGSGTYVTAPEGYREGNSDNWGIIVPNITESIYSEIVRGVEDVTQKINVNLILCNFDGDAQKQSNYIRRLKLTGVSGVILVPTLCEHSRELVQIHKYFSDIKKPFVCCNTHIKEVNVPVVTYNNFYGGYIATRLLIKKGYRKIAYISAFNYITSIERCDGYVSALLEYGIAVDRELIILGIDTETDKTGYLSTLSLLQRRDDIDSIFCFNDSLLYGVYKAINHLGKSISDDIGVIGFDNDNICLNNIPPSTSICGHKPSTFNFEGIAVKMWDEQRFCKVGPELVFRGRH